jgi:SAM-dependent methyltransferase
VGDKAVSGERPDAVPSDRWSRFAGQALAGGLAPTAYNSWLSHMTSLGYMLRFQPPPARVLSIGCGTAMFDILLAGYGYQVTSLDSDPEVLEAAARSARQFDVDLNLTLGDAFDLKEHHDRYDVAFSAGLVEHWHGTKAAELIKEHARCASRVQVEVPTRHTLLIEAVPEVIADAYLFRPGEFADRVRETGLVVEKVYTIGSVPTRTREVVESLIPPVLFRRIQRWMGYSMGIGCIAQRPNVKG